ncbi:GntR family transcriptional regulator [Amycolatopsis pithecellobii]
MPPPIGGSRRKPDDYPGYPYEWIADDIEARLVSGDLQHCLRLPLIEPSAYEYGVAITTYRRGLELLERRGLIVVVPGRGAFVISPQ